MEDDDTDTSSSTLTIVSPSPSPRKSRLPPAQINPGDLPPSYAHLEAEEREIIGREYLRKFHPGINSDKVIGSLIAPSLPVPSHEPSSVVVSQRAVEEWMRFKAETGRHCDAIDQVLLSRQDVNVSPADMDSSFYPSADDEDRPRQTERNVFLAGMGFAAVMMMACEFIYMNFLPSGCMFSHVLPSVHCSGHEARIQ